MNIYRGWAIDVRTVGPDGDRYRATIAKVPPEGIDENSDETWLDGLVLHPTREGALTDGRAQVDEILGD